MNTCLTILGIYLIGVFLTNIITLVWNEVVCDHIGFSYSIDDDQRILLTIFWFVGWLFMITIWIPNTAIKLYKDYKMEKSE